MDLREILEALYHENGGRLTASIVVEAARPETSPLHSQFDWDDESAAEKHRLDQARSLIRKVKIRYRDPDGETVKAPYFVSVAQSNATHAYVKTQEVAEDPVLTKIVLADAVRQWKALHNRYKHLAGFLTAVQASLAPPEPGGDAKAG